MMDALHLQMIAHYGMQPIDPMHAHRAVAERDLWNGVAEMLSWDVLDAEDFHALWDAMPEMPPVPPLWLIGERLVCDQFYRTVGTQEPA